VNQAMASLYEEGLRGMSKTAMTTPPLLPGRALLRQINSLKCMFAEGRRTRAREVKHC
jgi:hypothetical protein